MKLKAILKTLARIAPVVLTQAPAIIAAVREMKKAARPRAEP